MHNGVNCLAPTLNITVAFNHIFSEGASASPGVNDGYSSVFVRGRLMSQGCLWKPVC